MTPDVVTNILAYGPSGLIIVILLMVIKRLFDLYIEEQKAHRETAVAATNSSSKFAEALETTNEIARSTDAKVEALKDLMRDRFPKTGAN